MQMTKPASEGIHSGFETQGRHHQKSKSGVSDPIKRTDVLQKIKKNTKWNDNFFNDGEEFHKLPVFAACKFYM